MHGMLVPLPPGLGPAPSSMPRVSHLLQPHFSLPFQAFELATGDYLFEPHSGEDYSRDEGKGGKPWPWF